MHRGEERGHGPDIGTALARRLVEVAGPDLFG
jgi:hypothetical protein